jgi:hypothetical protein
METYDTVRFLCIFFKIAQGITNRLSCLVIEFNVGVSHNVDPGQQMVEIMELDYVDDTVSLTRPCSFLLPFNFFTVTIHYKSRFLGWENLVFNRYCMVGFLAGLCSFG